MSDIPQPEARIEQPGDRPLVYFPGFTWGEKSILPLVSELHAEAGAGIDRVIGLDYYSQSPRNFYDISKLGLHPQNATETLAAQALGQIEAAGLSNEPVDVVAFSYGSLIYQAAVEMSEQLEWRCFVGSGENDLRRAVLIAPSGLREHETTPKVMARYTKNIGQLALNNPLDEAFLEQQKRFFSSIVTRLREAKRLGNDLVDRDYLTNKGIVTKDLHFDGDDVFPYNAAGNTALEGSPSMLIVPGAVHSSPYIYPKQTALAVKSILETT